MRNCQAFAADLYGFLVGRNDMKPYLPLLRPLYTNHTDRFLYDPAFYTTDSDGRPQSEKRESWENDDGHSSTGHKMSILDACH